VGVDKFRREVEKLEEATRGRSQPEDEHEREKRRKMVREGAERINDRRRRHSEDPVFEITEDGDVFCVRDGKPVTDYHQTLAEEWYWEFREAGHNPRGLIHDEETEGYYMPASSAAPHELAFSRDRCYLPRYFWAIGGWRADPYCISVPERLDPSG
jgi:hypothetical protein